MTETDEILRSADRPLYKQEEVLRTLYHDEEMSIREIADEIDSAYSTVRDWMERLDIERRHISEAKYVESPGHRNNVRLEMLEQGYIVWWVRGEDAYTTVRVHRLIAVAEWGLDAIRGMDIHHKNGIPWDNRPENLEVIERGEHSRLHHIEIEEEERKRIADRYENKEATSYELAEEYGVANNTILDIYREYYPEQDEDQDGTTSDTNVGLTAEPDSEPDAVADAIDQYWQKTTTNNCNSEQRCHSDG